MQGQAKPSDWIPRIRMENFTDGVLAIVVTLMVLELDAPEATGTQSLLDAIGRNWEEYLSYLISFAFVGGFWIVHSRAMRMLERGNELLARLNVLWLLSVTLLPLSSLILIRNLGGPGERVAVAIWGLNLLIGSALLTVLALAAVRHRDLMIDGTDSADLKALVRQRYVLLGVQAVACVLAVLVPQAAILLYLAVAIGFLAAPLLNHLPRTSMTGSG